MLSSFPQTVSSSLYDIRKRSPSCPIITHHIIILPYPIPYPILSYYILLYPYLPYPTPSYSIISYFILSYLILSYHIPLYSYLPYPTLSYPILSYPTLSYPTPSLSYPTPSSPTLSYNYLSYPPPSPSSHQSHLAPVTNCLCSWGSSTVGPSRGVTCSSVSRLYRWMKSPSCLAIRIAFSTGVKCLPGVCSGEAGGCQESVLM